MLTKLKDYIIDKEFRLILFQNQYGTDYSVISLYEDKSTKLIQKKSSQIIQE